MRALAFVLLAACGQPITAADVESHLPVVVEALAKAMVGITAASGYPVDTEMIETRDFDGVAETSPSGALIKISTVIGEWSNLNELLAHEIGHVLGLPHSQDGDNVMRPYQGGSTIPLSVAAKQIAAACQKVGCRRDFAFTALRGDRRFP